MKNNMLIRNEDEILNFFKKIFHKKEKNEEFNIELQEAKKENNITNKLEERRKIAELQRQYEANTIKEEDLTEAEKESLIKLYKEQINTLKNNIQMEKKELELYKQKIIAAREKAKMQ